MKRGGQRAKGNAYELRIAHLLTEVYYPDEDGQFRRVPLSGGWDKRVAPGDIIALKYTDVWKKEMVVDKSFPFSIECKDWKDQNVKHFFSGLYSKESSFFEWMEQASEGARTTKKMPLVVFKLYRSENIVMLDMMHFTQLRDTFGIFPGGNWYLLSRYKPQEVQCISSGSFVFCLLKDFTNWIDWEVYKVSDKIRYVRSIIKKEE